MIKSITNNYYKNLKIVQLLLIILAFPFLSYSQTPIEIQMLDKVTSYPIDTAFFYFKESGYRHFVEDNVHLFKHKKKKYVYEESDNSASYLTTYVDNDFNKIKNWFDQNYRLDETINDQDGLQLTYFGNNKFWSLFHFSDDSGDWMMIVCMTKVE